MTSRRDYLSPQHLEQAAAWRIRLAESPDLFRTGFSTWLAEDPANDRAWRAVQGAWVLLAEQAASPSVIRLRRTALAHAYEALRTNRLRAKPNRPAVRMGVAAATLIAVGTSMLWWHYRPTVYNTGAGEQRSVRLAEGSRITLDASSEVTVRYTAGARTLALLKGQATFDVAHDPARPFTVTAEGHKVVATGTAFDVDMIGSELLVTLLKGHVVILPAGATVRPFMPVGAPGVSPHMVDVAVTGIPPDSQRIALDPGEQLVLAAHAPPQVSRVDVQRVMAWRLGELVFRNEPLSQVFARMDRYIPEPIVAGDARTAGIRISGVYQESDVEGFVSTLVSYLPLRAHQLPDGTMVLTYRGSDARSSASTP
ncbi:MAG: FecR family protein [Steroidobacteraceae bacterium]